MVTIGLAGLVWYFMLRLEKRLLAWRSTIAVESTGT